MSDVTLVVPAAVAKELVGTLGTDVETAGVVLGGLATSEDGSVRLIAREFHQVPAEGYSRRDADQLVVRSDGYMPALARAEQIGATAIWFHTHPGPQSRAHPSPRDHRVDDAIDNLFRARSASGRYATLILAGERQQPSFTGTLDAAGETAAITRLWITGARLRLLTASDHAAAAADNDVYDRSIRAFGGALQRALAALTVGVVGCGGTGSAVAEQLARLGVGRLVLVDPDTLSLSNLTRVYGSTPADVGDPKAVVLARHLERIRPDLNVRAIVGTVTTEATARGALCRATSFTAARTTTPAASCCRASPRTSRHR